MLTSMTRSIVYYLVPIHQLAINIFFNYLAVLYVYAVICYAV